MKFTLVEGNSLTGRSPAVPRHWLMALLIVIVAQWTLWTLTSISEIVAAQVVVKTNLLETFDFATGISAYTALAIDLVTYSALAVLAIVLSRKMDGRDLRALGLSKLAALEAAPWLLVGLAASIPTLVSFSSLAPGWLEMAGRALPLIVPATIIQAGAEEIIFRGVLLASLAAHYGAARGLLISAALFAFWHIYVGQPWPDMIFRAGTTFVFGVTAGLLALRQGHLGGVIVLHVVWNVVSHLAGGFEGWPDQFWESFVANFRGYGLSDALDRETVNATLLPLFIETVLILAATRTTYRQIFEPNAAPLS